MDFISGNDGNSSADSSTFKTRLRRLWRWSMKFDNENTVYDMYLHCSSLLLQFVSFVRRKSVNSKKFLTLLTLSPPILSIIDDEFYQCELGCSMKALAECCHGIELPQWSSSTLNRKPSWPYISVQIRELTRVRYISCNFLFKTLTVLILWLETVT